MWYAYVYSANYISDSFGTLLIDVSVCSQNSAITPMAERMWLIEVTCTVYIC